MPKAEAVVNVEACENCWQILACGGTEQPLKACDYGIPREGVALCLRQRTQCAVSGRTIFVPREKYPHYCSLANQKRC